MPEMNMAMALNHAIYAAMRRDETVLMMGEDVGRTGGVFRITDGLLEAFGEERVIDTPVAESGIVGASAEHLLPVEPSTSVTRTEWWAVNARPDSVKSVGCGMPASRQVSDNW